MNQPYAIAAVPCNGCTACCENDLLILHPEMGDNPDDYETQAVTHPLTGSRAIALKQRENGNCIYLEPGVGCSIHGCAPAICREFDCRLSYKNMLAQFTRAERRQLVKRGIYGRRVIEAGRKRLNTLQVPA